jgi:hypothetical protein
MEVSEKVSTSAISAFPYRPTVRHSAALSAEICQLNGRVSLVNGNSAIIDRSKKEKKAVSSHRTPKLD